MIYKNDFSEYNSLEEYLSMSEFGTFMVCMNKHLPTDVLMHIYAQYLLSTYNLNAPWFLCRNGNLQMLKYLDTLGVNFQTRDIISASGSGHLHIIKWFLKAHPEVELTSEVMDAAAEGGQLHIIKWLCENTDIRCTTSAMDGAAIRGHLEIVKFLHANRREGCTTRAMPFASLYGHFDVLKFLIENYDALYVRSVMNFAAQEGHLDMVKMLSENGKNSHEAVFHAVKNGHLDVVKWFCENIHVNKQDALFYSLAYALYFPDPIENCRLEVVKYLRENVEYTMNSSKVHYVEYLVFLLIELIHRYTIILQFLRLIVCILEYINNNTYKTLAFLGFSIYLYILLT